MSACRCWFCLRLLVISLVLLGFWGNIFIQDSLANSNPPSTPAGLSATPGPGQVTLAWNPNPEPDIKFYKIYISLSANGPFSWNSSAIHPTTTFTKTELFAGVTYYFKLSAVNTAGLESNPTDPVSVNPGNQLGFAETASSYIVQYYFNGKPVRYRFNKLTVEDPRGFYEQFAPEISFNDIAVTAEPWPNGLSGLILLSIGSGNFTRIPRFSGTVENFIADRNLTLRYRNIESGNGIDVGNIVVWISIEAGKPYLKIRLQATPSTAMPFTSSWNVFSAIGGRYNPANRVVVPYDENSYYVINGQALGIHYSPHGDTWSLRMGAEGTPYEHITTGFFSNPSEMMTMAEYRAMFRTQEDWPMGHDYCDGSNGDPQDSVPFGLDKIYGIYLNYQEDEGGFCIPGGLGYSWQNPSTAIRVASPSQPYVTELYYWVGEDNWTGQYGLNDESQYRFAIDIWQDVAIGSMDFTATFGRINIIPIRFITSSEFIGRDQTKFIVMVDNINVESIKLQVFDLAGRRIFDSNFVDGRRASWDLLAPSRQPIANGVYLYTVTVRMSDGSIRHSAIRRLVVLR
jgi:hypothetical protein